MRIAAGLMVVALVAGCATTAPSAPAPAAPKPAAAAPKAAALKTAAAPSGKALVKDSSGKQICRRQKEIGSNFTTRICKTADEWAAYDKANLEGVEQFKRDSMQTTGTPPMNQ